ncbi:MAG: SURF1 family protein [Candidatus Eisenbacteria bacterium]|uniref:SURF1-like protein n=1 Tax=Eiseniibacteriota bacterium TaxID=2212470 RepID=A0A849SRE4_UNCEI|nr:SURF1 family protein [Candidatus Eisenbacteria bacterium]
MASASRALPIVAAALVVASGCVWLGVWQLSRWSEKSIARAALQRSLAGAALSLGDSLPPDRALQGRVVELLGEFDGDWHVILTGRLRNEVPGVRLLTPFRVGSREILVDRGWIPTEDAASADPGEYAEPGLRRLRGFADSAPRHRALPLRRLERTDAMQVWQARQLDLDSIAAHRGTSMSRLLLTESADSLIPLPARDGPPLPDPGIHMSYAIQWFAFAAIVLTGSFFLAGLPRRAR